MEVVGGEGGAVATAAVEDEFGSLIRVEAFDVAFEDAAGEVLGGGGVTLLLFVVFAHVEEVDGVAGGEAGAGLFDVELADAGPGVGDESEKAFGVLHGVSVLGRLKVSADGQGRRLLDEGAGFLTSGAGEFT